jgi:hypothetical protein
MLGKIAPLRQTATSGRSDSNPCTASKIGANIATYDERAELYESKSAAYKALSGGFEHGTALAIQLSRTHSGEWSQ